MLCTAEGVHYAVYYNFCKGLVVMKKNFVIGNCYEDCFGQRYFAVDLDCFGNVTMLPIYPSNYLDFPKDSISDFKVVSYEGDK